VGGNPHGRIEIGFDEISLEISLETTKHAADSSRMDCENRYVSCWESALGSKNLMEMSTGQ
jgi:hypothetical protein